MIKKTQRLGVQTENKHQSPTQLNKLNECRWTFKRIKEESTSKKKTQATHTSAKVKPENKACTSHNANAKKSMLMPIKLVDILVKSQWCADRQNIIGLKTQLFRESFFFQSRYLFPRRKIAALSNVAR